jgi:hypothetical protein
MLSDEEFLASISLSASVRDGPVSQAALIIEVASEGTQSRRVDSVDILTNYFGKQDPDLLPKKGVIKFMIEKLSWVSITS